MHGVMLMRKTFRVAVLGTGMLSLLVGAGAFAAESRLDAFIARLKGADAAGRRQIAKSLSGSDRKALHAEYRALSPAAQKELRAGLAGARKAKASRGKSPKVIGTVQYDTGTLFNLRDNFGQVVGNRFNTGFGNPHTISVVTFNLNGTFSPGGTPVRVYGAPVGTIAPVLAQTTFFGQPNVGTFFTWDLPNIVGHNGTFLAGVAQSGSFSTINTTFVGINVDVNNGGQGFHGMNINVGGSGFNPNATVAPGQPFNAVFRATGENLPVELMGFDVQ